MQWYMNIVIIMKKFGPNEKFDDPAQMETRNIFVCPPPLTWNFNFPLLTLSQPPLYISLSLTLSRSIHTTLSLSLSIQTLALISLANQVISRRFHLNSSLSLSSLLG